MGLFSFSKFKDVNYKKFMEALVVADANGTRIRGNDYSRQVPYDEKHGVKRDDIVEFMMKMQKKHNVKTYSTTIDGGKMPGVFVYSTDKKFVYLYKS